MGSCVSRKNTDYEMTDQEQQDFLNSLKARVDRGEKLNEQEKFIYDLEMEDVGDPLSTKPTVTIPVIVCLGTQGPSVATNITFDTVMRNNEVKLTTELVNELGGLPNELSPLTVKYYVGTTERQGRLTDCKIGPENVISGRGLFRLGIDISSTTRTLVVDEDLN